MTILAFKILSIIFIITAGLVGGLIPIRKVISSKGSLRLVLGNAFAGGIFLGAGFMHMLPDAMDNFSSLHLSLDFPFASFLAGIGFILVLSLEKVIAKQNSSEASQSNIQFPFILFLILSIHSIIAGMSLGLETEIISGTVIFIAIIAHKGSASFALSVNLLQSKIVKKRIIRTILFFSIMTPIGIALGSFLSNIESSKISIWFEAIFDSLAAGTFLYIAILEIIDEVFENSQQKILKFSLLLFGFLLMALIALWV